MRYQLQAYYRPTRAVINLDALQHNIQAFRSSFPAGKQIMASVKANAYGHGAVQVAQAAVKFGVDWLGVAFLDEALELRSAGITAPILVLGYVPLEGLELARTHQIDVALFREDVLQALEQASPGVDREQPKLRVHIKVDTGMGRLGIVGEEAAIAFIERVSRCAGLEIAGLFTHYARADELDKSYTKQQYDRFSAIAKRVREQLGIEVPYVHAANSAAGIDTPEWTGDIIRLGISMYGLYPSEEVSRTKVKLRPVLTLKSEVVHEKLAPAGWGISYGSRYVTSDEEWIGSLPIGYADGYSRMLTGKAEVLIRGQRVSVLGTICMDQCMIELARVRGDHSCIGEEVVLLGEQGDEVIPAEEIARTLGTINYEVTCMLAARVPRVYTLVGQVIFVENNLFSS